MSYKICAACSKMLHRWNSSRHSKEMKYNKPTLWKEPLHENDCNFCMNDVTLFNRKNKQSYVYINVKTVEKPERSWCNKRNYNNFENKNHPKVRNDSDEADESRKNIEYIE